MEFWFSRPGLMQMYYIYLAFWECKQEVAIFVLEHGEWTFLSLSVTA